MIYDCFSFFNELDLLEIRLNTLDKVVDRFVLAESHFTHTGNPKPLYYADNKERFAKFNDRIIHVVTDDFPSVPNVTTREMAWIRENWQRNAIMRGIPEDTTADDILIVSDLDEIPDPYILKKACAGPKGVTLLQLKYYSFYLNMRDVTRPIWFSGPKILSLETFHAQETFAGVKFCEACPEIVNQGPTPTKLRFLKADHIISPAGWHFTYLGGVEAIISKIKSFAHKEDLPALSAETIRTNLMRGRGYCNGSDRYMPEVFDDSFPEYIRKNQDRFSAHILPCDHNPPKWLVSIYQLKTYCHDNLFRVIIALTPRFLVATRTRLYLKFRSWLQK